MKTRLLSRLLQRIAFPLLVSMLNAQRPASAQSTAFTYQGRLNDGGAPANGFYDFQFTIYDAAAPPDMLLVGPLARAGIAVSNGLFTVTLDFGSGVFTGPPRWLEIAARPNGVGAFTTLTPRQPLTPAPYALFALNTASSLYNFAGGSYATVGGGYGNQATNYTTTVGGGRDNVAGGENGTVGGGALNKVVGYAATVAGGYLNCASNYNSTVGGGFENVALGESSTVSGGYANTSSGFRAAVGGGDNNISSGRFAVIAGGDGNSASGNFTTVGGGPGNQATNTYATIGGGGFGTSGGYASTVPGGYLNLALGDYSFAAGRRAKAAHSGTFVWADSFDAMFSSTSSNQFLIRASGGVGIGTNAPSNALSVSGDADFSGKVGLGIAPQFGLDLNRELVVYDNHISFRRSGAHRWILEELAGTGLRIRQAYDDALNLVNLVRLEVADNGNVAIGVSNPGYLLDVGGRMRVRDGGGSAGLWFNSAHSSGAGGVADIAFIGIVDPTRLGFYGNDPRGGSGWGLTFDTVSGNVGIGTGLAYPNYKLQVNGAVAGVGDFANISDRRYKKDVATLAHALDKVLQLRGVNYDWRAEDYPSLNFNPGRQVGFIAQEVQAVLPEVVSEDRDGVQSVAYSKVVPVLVEAIKEQQRQITSLALTSSAQEPGGAPQQAIQGLNQKLEQKETEITELKQRLEALEKIVHDRKSN